MALADLSPNKLSLLILLGIAVIAGGYAIATYSGQPGRNSFTPLPGYQFAFDLSRPTQSFNLPSELDEISGVTMYEDNKVLTIQDEDGILYVYDLDKQRIEHQLEFGKQLDYEDVALNDTAAYVLEADGDLHVIPRRDIGKTQMLAPKLETLFSYRDDLEGLCFDPVSGYLLLTPKEEKLEESLRSPDYRGIYAYDLAERRLLPDPIYTVDMVELGEIIYGKPKEHLFKPSGIAVQPGTGHLFVLASVGKVLLVLDRNGQVLHLELLDRRHFRQPEGITFDHQGNLLISSEADGETATLMRFALRPYNTATNPAKPAENERESN